MSVTPSSGSQLGGTQITIKGNKFGGLVTVTFNTGDPFSNGPRATQVEVTADQTQIACVTPAFATPGPANVFVSTSTNGTVAAIGGFLYVSPPTPTPTPTATPTPTPAPAPPSTPSVVSPAANATNVLVNPLIGASPFSDPDGDTHASSTWEVYDNASLAAANLVWSKADDPLNLTLITVATANGTFANALNGQTGLANSTDYFVRVRYTDSRSAASVFSTASKFTTRFNVGPATPSITSPSNNATGVAVNPPIQSSTFSDPGDTHGSSTWEIYDNVSLAASNLVWSKIGDTSNLTSIVVNGTSGTFSNALGGLTALANNTAYFVRVRYTDSRSAASVFSAVSKFTTGQAIAFTTGRYVNESSTLNGNGVIQIAGPGVTDSGAFLFSLAAAPNADRLTYPTTAMWFVGPIADNPLAARISLAGITPSASLSYGIGDGTINTPGSGFPSEWRSHNKLLAFSQSGDNLSIFTFTDENRVDRSTPVGSITYRLATPTTALLTPVSSFQTGTYLSPPQVFQTSAQATISVGGSASGGSLNVVSGSPSLSYPTGATWFVGPIESNPFASRLTQAGLASSGAVSYGVGNGTTTTPGSGFPSDWRSSNKILGFSQIGNTLSILLYTDENGGDHSSPIGSITYSQ